MAIAAHNEPPPPAASNLQRVHLDFLDGMRGFAALYVVLFHCSNNNLNLPPALAWIPQGLQFGHFSVGVFIVLSGYCLMLPVARSAEGSLKGGISGYLKRRALRILPPYYAALLLSIVFNWVSVRFINHGAFEALAPGQILSHILLIHNWRSDWVATINWPLWSVAVEWQIYFFLPLLLLPIWRKVGVTAMLTIALMLGLLPHLFLPERVNFDWSCPWYLGLFAYGVAGAVLTYSQDVTHARVRNRAPWLLTSLLFAVSTLFVFWKSPSTMWLQDNLIGIGTVCLILGCVQITRSQGDCRRNWHSALPILLLESRFALWLGSFSYSLYLIQQPAQRASYFLKNHLSLSASGQLAFQLLVTVPWIVLSGWMFYQVCERHCVRAPGSHRPA